MSILRSEDLNLIRAARKNNFLQDLKVEKLLDIKEPTGMILCSDGHQRKAINDYISKLWANLQAEEIIHEIKFAGAPLFSAKSSIVSSRFHEDEFIMDQIAKGIKLGKISKRLIIFGHWGCGLANEYDLSLHDCFEVQVRGMERILKEFPQLTVSTVIQIDYRAQIAEKDRKTYHIETPAWRQFATEFAQYDYTSRPLFAGSAKA
ncbi:MAG: hypothetical protein M3Q64_03070 [bacterium]|nr:hypothetical protein [bacterium]